MAFHVCVLQASRVSLQRVSCLEWALWQTTTTRQFHMSCFSAVLFFYPLVFQRQHDGALLNVNMFRAGPADGLGCWRALCVSVSVQHLLTGPWVGSLTTSKLLTSASYSLETCQPDVEPLYWQPQTPPPHHGDPHSCNSAPLSLHITELRCKQQARCSMFLPWKKFGVHPTQRLRKTLI